MQPQVFTFNASERKIATKQSMLKITLVAEVDCMMDT